jgi:hypothetical protein
MMAEKRKYDAQKNDYSEGGGMKGWRDGGVEARFKEMR